MANYGMTFEDYDAIFSMVPNSTELDMPVTGDGVGEIQLSGQFPIGAVPPDEPFGFTIKVVTDG